MKIILERHTYAPELNTAYVGPTHSAIRVSGLTTIGEVRRALFAPLKYRGRHVVIKSINCADMQTYDRTVSGFCLDLRSLRGALNVFKARHCLPGVTYSITTKLIG